MAALPLMLAGTALVVRRSRERVAVALVGAAALAVATGSSPVYDLVLELPGFAAANNGRFAVVTVLCLAVLAGWGLDDLARVTIPGRRPNAVLALSLSLLVAPFVVVFVGNHVDTLEALGPALQVAWGFEDPEPGAADVIRLASLLEWLVFAAGAVMLVVLRLRRRLRPAIFVALAVALVAADLFKAGMGYNPAIPRSAAQQPVTPAIRFLREKRPARFSGLQATAPISLALPLVPNVAMRYGLYDARGNVTPTEERYYEIFRRVIGPRSDCYFLFCTQIADSKPKALQALGLLGVRYLLQNRADRPLPQLRAAYTGRDARVYLNPKALPRAFLWIARSCAKTEARRSLS